MMASKCFDILDCEAAVDLFAKSSIMCAHKSQSMWNRRLWKMFSTKNSDCRKVPLKNSKKQAYHLLPGCYHQRPPHLGISLSWKKLFFTMNKIIHISYVKHQIQMRILIFSMWWSILNINNPGQQLCQRQATVWLLASCHHQHQHHRIMRFTFLPVLSTAWLKAP